MDGGSSTHNSSACPYLRRQSVKRSETGMNATRSSNPGNSSTTSLFVPQDDHYHSEHAPRRRRLSPEPGHHPVRYPGDGFDYRRPIMSTPQSLLIDLTGEDERQRPTSDVEATHFPRHPAQPSQPSRAQRLPRYERNIISITSEEEDVNDLGGASGFMSHSPNDINGSYSQNHPQFSVLRRPSRNGSSSREGHDNQSGPSSSHILQSSTHQQPRSTATRSQDMNNTIDLTDDNDDDVVHVDTRPRPGITLEGPDPGVRNLHAAHQAAQSYASRIGSRLMERIRAIDSDIWATSRVLEHQINITNLNFARNRYLDQHRDTRGPRLAQEDAIRPVRPQPDAGLMGYTNLHNFMNYAAPAFDLGLAGGNRPPSPKYEPPSDAAPGFTRSPEENEVVVCPNCGDELAMGQSDTKQEIWVIKSCGHAYCGMCAQSGTKSRRAPRQSGKGKGRASDDASSVEPLRACVVDGCPGKVTKTSIIRIYSS